MEMMMEEGKDVSLTNPNKNVKDKNVFEEMDWDLHIGQLLNSSKLQSTVQDGPCVNSVFRWHGQESEVYVCGSYDNWTTKKPLIKTKSSFLTILSLPQGTHFYKYLVNGEWRIQDGEPITTISTSDNNTANNILENSIVLDNNKNTQTPTHTSTQTSTHTNTQTTTQTNSHTSTHTHVLTLSQSDADVFVALAYDDVTSSNSSRLKFKTGWTKELPIQGTGYGFQRYSPHHLPPQLCYPSLNNPTTLQCDPSILLEPPQVTLNHLYTLSIKEGILVMGSTYRYRKKYITTILYKPI